MKKIVLMFAFATMLISATAQEWTVNFQYADKLFGLPNRYECSYTDADSIIRMDLRTDLSFVELTLLQGDFKQYDDSVQVILYDDKGNVKKTLMMKVSYYKTTVMKIRSWNIVDNLTRGEAVDIILYMEGLPKYSIKIFPIRQNDLIAQNFLKNNK